jgi:hypothetical protein
VGKLTGRRNLEQLATFEPFLPPVETLEGRHHALPPEGMPDDCDNGDLGPTEQFALDTAYNAFETAWNNWWAGYDDYHNQSNVYWSVAGALVAIAVGIAACLEGGPFGCAAGAGAGLLSTHDVAQELQADDDLGDSLYTVAPGPDTSLQEAVENTFAAYKGLWEAYGCGSFPFTIVAPSLGRVYGLLE